MKALKVLFGLGLVALFSALLYLVFQAEEKEAFEMIDTLSSIQASPIKNQINSVELDTINENVSSIFDVKGVVKDNQFTVFQLDEEKSTQQLPFSGFSYLLSSDLNVDEQAEFWLLFKQNKKVKILGFQWEKSKLIPLNFPEIKGRQKMGYIGNDSLYLEKGLLVRDFQFVNDPFAESANGFRKCYYTFGKDKSFVLHKTIDYEKR
jgi:hypothetical protein